MSVNLLEARDVAIDYLTGQGPLHAVTRGSFSVPAGAAVGIVGESGCGKTTLARALTGVMARNAKVVGGEMIFRDADLLKMPAAARRELLWRAISFVPQSAMNALNPVYRVGAQIEEVLRQRGGLDRRATRRRVDELFEMVGLDPSRQRDYPHQFSGGMRQRACIAQALALDPDLVVADEPVTALDVIVQRQVLDTMRELQERLGLSIVIVTHDISVVAFVSARVVVMYAGEVVEEGDTGAVLGSPHHPYTMGLTNAFPDLTRSGGSLASMAGALPDLRLPPPGCRFAPRCPFALALCHSEAPPLAADASGRITACWRADEAATLAEEAKDPSRWTSLSTSAA